MMDGITSSYDYLWMVDRLITGDAAAKTSRDAVCMCVFRLHDRLIGGVAHLYSVWCNEAFVLCASTVFTH